MASIYTYTYAHLQVSITFVTKNCSSGFYSYNVHLKFTLATEEPFMKKWS